MGKNLYLRVGLRYPKPSCLSIYPDGWDGLILLKKERIKILPLPGGSGMVYRTSDKFLMVVIQQDRQGGGGWLPVTIF